jgi:hypothetical protein
MEWTQLAEDKQYGGFYECSNEHSSYIFKEGNILEKYAVNNISR